MLPARSWIDPTQEDLKSPPIEQGTNLPVEKPNEIVPFKQRVRRPSSYFDYELTSGSGKYLIGQGQQVWDEESMKAEVQPFMNKLGSGLVSRSASLIPKIGENIGHIAGAIGYGMDYINDPNIADPNQIWDNALINTMSKADQSYRDALPIYKSYAARNGN
jgi:hypothetical protein